MKFAAIVIAAISVVILAGCGGSSDSSRLADVSEPFRTLPPSLTFSYVGTAVVNEGGVNRTVPASSTVTIGKPGFIDPRTNTPMLLYTQTFTVETVESLMYRDFFFSQQGSAPVAHGSEVLGVPTFEFTPETLLPAQLAIGQVFGEQTEPYQTLTVTLRDARVIRADRIRVAGSLVDTFEVHRVREIPFGITITRRFDETDWYAPGIVSFVPVQQRIRYTNLGTAVTLNLELVAIPVLP